MLNALGWEFLAVQLFTAPDLFDLGIVNQS